MTKPYDSFQDTLVHIGRVRELMSSVIGNLSERARVHDASKLVEPEKNYFDRITAKLKDLKYGSEEYRSALAELKPALDHHYAANSHHPEHYQNGVQGMTLLDLLEMLADWKAAGERHTDGSLERSLTINKTRFNVSPELQLILENTARELLWV